MATHAHANLDPVSEDGSFDPREQASIDRKTRHALRRMGRSGAPTKLTPQLFDQLRDVLQLCVTWKTAALYCGVHHQTLQQWRKKGKDDLEAGVESLYAALVEMIEETKAEAQVGMASVVINAAARPDGEKAAIEILKRRFPDDWSETRRSDYNPGGGPLVIQIGLNTQMAAVQQPAQVDGPTKGFQLIEAGPQPAQPGKKPVGYVKQRIRDAKKRRRLKKPGQVRHDAGDEQS